MYPLTQIVIWIYDLPQLRRGLPRFRVPGTWKCSRWRIPPTAWSHLKDAVRRKVSGSRGQYRTCQTEDLVPSRNRQVPSAWFGRTKRARRRTERAAVRCCSS